MEPNNGSTSSLASFQDATGGRLKDRVRRKPVPKYLPDPPRKHSSPSPPSPFRQLTALANANIHKDHPPLPDDWQQTIAKALDMERHVERPAAPTPDIESEVDVEAEGGYVTTLNPADPSEKVVEQPKAVPKLESKAFYASNAPPAYPISISS
ncbi:hypothetical protein EW026_g6181 [Hermanssonia centrifuga]|uniref:Uncharacterized protein n=1 Tax=Hermanssonia centrifuga TaxID=98765 RepID=A0A4S4KC29_9APHY|nr:hypothetical protein EW026_g6181 [Hermanssonia centrifuga]